MERRNFLKPLLLLPFLTANCFLPPGQNRCYYVKWEFFDKDNPEIGGMDCAYSTKDNGYIGTPEEAKWLCDERGILVEKASSEHNVCSIGFCKKENKWYGWSHRAIAGFTIGNKIYEDDFGDDNTKFIEHGRVTITNMEEAKLSAKRFAESVS